MYRIEYEDKQTFKRLERGLKKYNVFAYKKFAYEICPKLERGNFEDATLVDDRYELVLPTYRNFGTNNEYKVIFRVVNNTIIMLEITPQDFLLSNQPMVYKGVLVSKDNIKEDMFKINLINQLTFDKDGK